MNQLCAGFWIVALANGGTLYTDDPRVAMADSWLGHKVMGAKCRSWESLPPLWRGAPAVKPQAPAPTREQLVLEAPAPTPGQLVSCPEVTPETPMAPTILRQPGWDGALHHLLRLVEEPSLIETVTVTLITGQIAKAGADALKVSQADSGKGREVN